MLIFLIITSVFVFIFSVIIGILAAKMIKLASYQSKMEDYIKGAVNKINQARYGNFQIKLDEKEDDPGLYKSLNDLFESITDRDLVINEYREKEKENYNLKEEFMAALTHDLKVPIIAADKTYDLLISNKFGNITENQKEVIIKLKESNDDLIKMVNSILETYKIENSGIELNIEENIDVEEFIKSVVESSSNIAKSQGKEINFYMDTKKFQANFDKMLIKRVINNLIINAINHSVSTNKIDIHLNKTGDTFSIDVIDFGEGIDEDEIEKIFNKYYSITNKTTRVSTGLGLYLSNKIVKKHKGIIEAESKKNEGSIFRIILPLKIL